MNLSKADLNDCLQNVFTYLTPRLKDGIPELNIPAMDPLMIDKAKYQLKSNDFQLRVILKNVVITGFMESILKDVDFEMNGDRISLKTHNFVPSLNTTGSYKAEMMLSAAPSYYEGKFDVSLMDVDCINEFEGEILEICNCNCQDCECNCGSENAEKKRIVQLISYNMIPTVGNMELKLSGLNPDPTISTYGHVCLHLTNFVSL